MSVESLPGFVGWFREGEEAGERHAFSIQCWGLRRVAVFDHELTGDEQERALHLLELVPKEYDPIAEMRIEVFPYWTVVVDVSRLHLESPETKERAYQLLDPEGSLGTVGLANMAVLRMREAFSSPDAARRFAGDVTSLGLSCQLKTEEGFLSEITIEDGGTLAREVARRRTNGGDLVTVCPDERLLRLYRGFDV